MPTGDARPRAPTDSVTGDDRARDFLMETLAGYYDFKNLFRWKKKFNPVFEDRYLVYPDALALPRVARALLRLQTPAGLRSYFRRPAPQSLAASPARITLARARESAADSAIESAARRYFAVKFALRFST